jgi:hypothetical protein
MLCAVLKLESLWTEKSEVYTVWLCWTSGFIINLEITAQGIRATASAGFAVCIT